MSTEKNARLDATAARATIGELMDTVEKFHAFSNNIRHQYDIRREKRVRLLFSSNKIQRTASRMIRELRLFLKTRMVKP